MRALHTASTERCAPRLKALHWSQAVSSAIGPARLQPADDTTYSGELAYFDLGPVRFTRLTSDPGELLLGPATGRSFLYFQVLSGTVSCSPPGAGPTRASAGDFWLHNRSRGAELRIEQPATVLTLTIPRELLSQHLPCPDAACNWLVTGRHGAAALAADFVQAFWRHAEAQPSSDRLAGYVAQPLQLIAAAYAVLTDPARQRRHADAHLKQRIQAYVEAHLRDPDLAPRTVATALNLTTSYMHRIFSAGGESLARYIHRRRLEEIFRALQDNSCSGRSITTIAFDHGFNSLPHFCRVFREHYGLSAGALQRQKLLRPHIPRQAVAVSALCPA